MTMLSRPRADRPETHGRDLYLLQWMATARCQLRCPHCLSRGERPLEGLSTERALRLVDEAAEVGVEELLITGGEPLLREDLPLIWARLSARGVPWSLNTAIPPSPEQRAALRAHPPIFAAVSLDGPEALHDAFRGRAGCHQGALEALHFFKEIGVPVGVGTTVTRVNFEALEEMVPLVRDLEPASWGLHLLVPEGGAQLRPDLFLDAEQLAELIRFVARLRPELPVQLADEAGALGALEPLVRDLPFSCGAGRASAVITPSGALMPCYTQDPDAGAGSLLDSSLAALWARGFPEEIGGHDCRECWLRRPRFGMDLPRTMALAVSLAAPTLAAARIAAPAAERPAERPAEDLRLNREAEEARLLFDELLPHHGRRRIKLAPEAPLKRPTALPERVEAAEGVLEQDPLTPMGVARAWRLLLEPRLDAEGPLSAKARARLKPALARLRAALPSAEAPFSRRLPYADARERHFMMSKAAPPRAASKRFDLWRRNMERRWGLEARRYRAQEPRGRAPRALGAHLLLEWRPRGGEARQISPFELEVFTRGWGTLEGIEVRCPGGALTWMDWLRLAWRQKPEAVRASPPSSPLHLPRLREEHRILLEAAARSEAPTEPGDWRAFQQANYKAQDLAAELAFLWML